jgi:glycosyltransferase involved in cell wall biosynthesis
VRCALEASYLLDSGKTGVQYYTQGLVQGLAELEDGPEVTLLMPRRPRASELPEAVERAIAERRMAVCSLPMPRLWLRVGVPVLVGITGAEVCHLPGTIVPRLLGAQPVVTVHDCCWVHHPHCYPRRELDLLWTVVINSVRRAAAVVVHSEQTKADCVAVMGVNEERVVVTPDAARCGLRPAEGGKEAARRALGLSRPYVLNVGTICRRKNQSRLVAAMGLLREGGQLDFDLVLAGAPGFGGEEVLRLRSSLRLDQEVQVRGYVGEAELGCLYQGAEALVFPSLCEGFGLPVLEAMACGTPVVTSDVGALRETGGDAAEYCDPNDVESIAHSIRSITEDAAYRAALVERGLQRAKGFIWRDTAERTVRAYRLALSRQL